MAEKEPFIDWHSIVQSILDEHLPMMSGKVIKKSSREHSRFIEIDYYCVAEGQIEKSKPMVRPFDHLKARNIIEFKSLHEVLNEAIFRQYVGRALVMENPDRGTSYQGEMTLTILTTRKPETLIAQGAYSIEQINDWKYVSHWVKNLEIIILVQKGMRGKKEGEALALLQVLEGEKERQLESWQEILSQDLSNVEFVKKIIHKISKERYMSLVEELKIEGRIEGRIEELLDVLSWTAPMLVEKYETKIRAIKTAEALDAIKSQIKREIEEMKR